MDKVHLECQRRSSSSSSSSSSSGGGGSSNSKSVSLNFRLAKICLDKSLNLREKQMKRQCLYNYYCVLI